MRLLMITLLMTGLGQAGIARADGMVDPTKPPASVMAYLPNAQTQAEQPWVLTAIQENGKTGFAVVNGQMVPVGGNHEGFKLTSVKNRQALFMSKTGEKKVLSMGLSSFIPEAAPPLGAKKDHRAKKIKKSGSPLNHQKIENK